MNEARAMTATALPGIFWIQEWSRPGITDFRIGREDDSLIAEWKGVCSMRASRSGELQSFTVLDGIDDITAKKVRDGMAAGLLRHLLGRLAFHASGVSSSSGAVAFLGESRAGKSTTAAQLCRDSDVEMLSDDTLFVEQQAEGFDALPTEKTHWLREDAARLFIGPTDSPKVPWAGARPSSRPRNLRTIVKLTFDDSLSAPSLRRAEGVESFQALIRSQVRFAIDDPFVTLRDFGLLSRVAAVVPMYELRRPCRLSVLPAVAELIRSSLWNATPSTGEVR